MIEIPEEILNPTGLIGDLSRFIQANSYKGNAIGAYAGALCALSYIIGARYRTASDVYPGLYIIVLGATGSGKDAIFRSIQDIADSLTEGKNFIPFFDDGLISKCSSRQGVEDALIELRHRPDVLVEIDEAGKFLQGGIGKAGNDTMRHMSTFLIETYNTKLIRIRKLAKGSGHGSASTDPKPTKIRFPSVTVMGATNMTSLLNGIGSEQINDGFINRFMWFDMDLLPPVIKSRNESVEVPSRLKDKLFEIAKDFKNEATKGRAEKYCKVKYEEGVEERFVEYDRMLLTTLKTEQERAFKTRLVLQAIKHAIIYAVAANPKKPRITMEQAELSLAIMAWQHDMTQEKLMANMVHDNIKSIVEEVKAFMDKNTTMTQALNGSALYSIDAYRNAPRAKVARLQKAVRDEFADAFADQYLVLDRVPNGSGKGANMTLYIRKNRKGFISPVCYKMMNGYTEEQKADKKYNKVYQLTAKQIDYLKQFVDK